MADYTHVASLLKGPGWIASIYSLCTINDVLHFLERVQPVSISKLSTCLYLFCYAFWASVSFYFHLFSITEQEFWHCVQSILIQTVGWTDGSGFWKAYNLKGDTNHQPNCWFKTGAWIRLDALLGWVHKIWTSLFISLINKLSTLS